MRPPSVVRLLLALAAAVSIASAARAGASWSSLPRVEDASYQGALELTPDVRHGAATLPLVPPLAIGGVTYDGLLVGEGFVHFVLLPGGRVPAEPTEDAPAGDAPLLGPRIDVLPPGGLRLAPEGRVLARLDGDRLALRWAGLQVRGRRGTAIVELLMAPDDLRVQYLHVPEGFVKPGGAVASATSFRLLDPGGELVLEPHDPPEPMSSDPPPAGCDPAVGTWCDLTPGTACDGGSTPCTTRVADEWHFNEGDYCRNCQKTFYVLVECGREMHFPMDDMEAFDFTITNVVTGQRPNLRCVNQTALGEGPDEGWNRTCSGSTNRYWPPPLDVTNNAGQGHVIASDSTPEDGDCTTKNDPTCAELPPGGGVAATVVYGEDQTIDCFVEDPTGLCGIYRIDIVSGGFVWDLFANCDGTDSPNFDIYWDCTEAWAAYNPLPELAIRNPSAPGDCWTYDVTFEVENIGCVDELADVPIRITSECGDLLDVVVPGPIPAHGTVPFTQRMTLSCPQSTLTILLDPDDAILECTESDAAAKCEAESGNDQLTVATECCPVVDAGADKVACAGEAVALADASSQFGDVFSWSDGGAGGTFSPSAAIRNPSYVPASGFTGLATLTLTATFSGSGCSRSDSLVVDVRPRPVAEGGDDKNGCAGDAIALFDAGAPGADTFSWSDGGAGGVFEPSASVASPAYVNAVPGEYLLTLVAAVGATGCDSSDTVTVTLHPDPEVTAGVDLEICEDGTADLAGSGAGAHDLAWSDGGAGGTFTPSHRVLHPSYQAPGPGTYQLTLSGTEVRLGAPVSGDPLLFDGMDAPAAPRWTPATAETTPSGRTILGRFSGSESVTLELSGLPPHSELSACFDLVVAGSWDGHAQADPAVGPDLFEVRVEGGPVLFHSSFAASAPRLQSFPDAYQDALGTDSPAHPARTGAVAVDSLGYAEGDAVHRVSLTFAHSGSTLRLVFQGLNLEGLADESWGLDDVTVGLRPCASCTTTDSLELVVHELPGADAGSDTGACVGEIVFLDDAAPGTADTFLWDDGGAGGTFLPSASVVNPEYDQPALGAYSLTLTATSTTTGCTSVDTVLVTIGERPVVDAGPALQTCAAQPLVIDQPVAGTGDTFLWSDGGGGGSFSPNNRVLHPTYTQGRAGIYTLTLTATEAATGCAGTDTVQVQVNANPLVDAGTDKTGCAAAGIPMDDAFAGSGTTVLWSDGGAGGTFSPSATVLEPEYSHPVAGTYALTLTATRTSTGCTSSDSVQVTVQANPSVSAGADKATCAGALRALSDATSGAASVQWSDGGSGGTFTPSATALNPSYRNTTAGTYTLTLSGTTSGCTVTDTLVMTVNPNPAVNAGLDKEACVSTPVALADATSSADAFSWSDGGGGGTFTPSASVRNPSYQNATAGVRTLTLTATVSATGCVSTDTLQVTVRQLPDASFAPIGTSWCEDVPVCFDNTSTGGTGWSWSFGAGGTSSQFEPCFTYSSPGTYTVQLTASNVCGTDVESRQITISPKPVADFSYSTQGGRFCKERPVTFTDLSTGGPTSWQWDFGDGTTSTAQNPSHTYAMDGLFIVTLRACNACGCSPPRFRSIEILASCQTNCEANSNQIGCQSGSAIENGDTCTNHGNFNTTSYPCAPGIVYTGENKIHDLNFDTGDNFIIRLIETVPEPNGYDLDIMISDSCNPPNCVAWGDTEVRYDDRTAANDDFFVIVDGRDGTCGPYRLEVQCLSPSATGQCTAPTFPGITSAADQDACSIPGILVTWPAVVDWGKGPDGAACASGSFEIWRAPSADLADETRVGSAPSSATQFVDTRAVPRESFSYRVNAINDCCAQPAITTVRDEATDDFGNTIEADAGGGGTITCLSPQVGLLGTASGGTGAGFSYSWSPTAGLSDPTIPNPTATLGAAYTMTVTDLGDGCSMTDVVVVVADDEEPLADAGPDRELTCETGVVTLQGSAVGGNDDAGYQFAWQPAGLVANPFSAVTTTATPGTYTLTVTAVATGCTDTDTVVVTSSTAAPVANAGPNTELTCASATVTLQGSASGGDGSDGYLYSWTPAAGLDDPSSPTPAASQPGTYVLLVTDAHTGCTDTDSVVVQLNAEDPVADAGAGATLGCAGDPVQLDGSALGGDGSEGYAFAWSPPEAFADPTAEDPSTQVPGTYSLTVTDVRTGCTATDTVVVAPGPGPAAEAGPSPAITCDVATVTLSGSGSGGDGSQGYSYSWEPAALVADPASPVTTTSTPGSYVLTVTSIADGCAGSDAVLVRDLTGGPIVDAGPGSTLSCALGTVTLQGSAAGGDDSGGRTFAWSPPGAVSDPSAAQPTTSTPGTYSLTVTDLATGCSSSDTVVVGSDTAAPSADAGPGSTLTCAVTSVTLQGSASGGNGGAGFAYAWSPAASVSDPAAAAPATSLPGTYTLTVTDLANGCSSTDTVTIAQDIAPPVADAGPDRSLACGGPGVTLQGAASGGNGSAGYSFRWEPAAGVTDPDSAVTQATAAGTYVLTVTAIATGCTDTDTALVTSTGAPSVDAGPASSITCADPSADLVGTITGGNGSQGFTIQWSPPAGVADPGDLVTSTLAAGTYSLLVTDVATGCRAVDSVVIADATGAPVAEAGPSPRLTCGQPVAALSGSGSGGGGGAGYAFEWQPADLVDDPASATTTTSTPGTYLLTVIDVATGCTDTDVVLVEDGREAPTASAGGDQVRDCSRPVATLAGSAGGGDGSSGYAFAWSPPAAVSDPAAASTTTSSAGTYTLTVTDLETGCTDEDQVVVTDDFAAPSASAGADKVIDCEDPMVALDGSAAGGNGSRGYSYAWSPAADVSNPVSATPMALAAGTFTLTVTDRANGCTATDTVVVTDQTVPPAVDAGPARLLDCDTSIVTLSGSASGGNGSLGYLHAWEPSGDVADPDAAVTETAAPGTYSLTVTDVATGCIAVDTVVVTQDLRAPRALAGPDRTLSCSQAQVTLQGSATGGNASSGYAYHWEPAADVSDAGAAQPQTAVAGTYTLTVTAIATGCTDTDTVVVRSNAVPPIASAGPDSSLNCDASIVTLQGAAAGGDATQGYAFAWSPPGSVSDPSIARPTTSTPGTYTLTVTAIATGCTDTDEVVVEDFTTPATASAGPDQLLDCDSARVTLLGSASGGDGSLGYGYAWAPAGSVSNPGVAQPTTAIAGTYVLTVTDLATGCVSTDSVTIGRDERRPLASAGADRRIDCTSPVATLQGSASGGNGSQGYSYSWTPAAQVSNPASPTPQVSEPGTYTLTVTAIATGCTDTDTVLVVVDETPPEVTAGPDEHLDCSAPAVVLRGQATGGNGSLGYSFSWNPATGLSDPSVPQPTASTGGTWTLTVTDLANGCSASDDVTVTQDVAAPVAEAGPDQVLDCSAATVPLSGSASGGNGSAGYAWSWQPAGAVTDPTAPDTEATASGTFTLTVTDLANGCTDTDVVVVASSQAPPVVDAGPGGSITCTSAIATLTGSATGGDGSLGYSYEWSPAADVADPTSPVTSTAVPGTYTLLAEDLATGCRAADVVVVADDRQAPLAEAGPARVLTCAAGTVTLQGSASGGNGTGGYAYAWEPAGSVSDPSAAQPQASSPGTYTVTVTDLVSGCTDSDQVVVTTDFAAPTASAGPDLDLGCRPSVALQGSGATSQGGAEVSYAWSPQAGLSDPASATPTATLPGTYVLTVTSLLNGCTATDSVTVGTNAAAPVASAGPDPLLTCTNPAVPLQGSASGGLGTLGYSYAWEPADSVSDPTIPQPLALAPGTFVLTITDLANGCTDTDDVTVLSDIDTPSANAGSDAVLDCGDAGVQLTGAASGGNGSAGYSYRWEPAGAVTSPDTAVTQATAAGTYTLTVTDLANGCTDTDTAVVTLSQAPPTANAGADSVIRCDRPNATLQGSASGGDGRLGYAASWTPTAGVANPASFTTTTSVPGTYTLTVTDVFTGCRSFDTVTITQDLRAPSADAGAGGTITCSNPTVPLAGSAAGGNGSQGYTYAWSPAAGVANPDAQSTTASQPGTYTLTVTDRANGCQATDTVVVDGDNTPVTANAGPNKSVTCTVADVTLDGSHSGGSGTAGFAYAWTPAAPLSDPASPTPSTSTAGTYTLTVVDVATGCSDTDTVVVSVNRTPPNANAGLDQTITCTTTTVTLTATPNNANMRYNWSPPGDVSDPTVRQPTTSVPGTYTLTVTDVRNGCVGVDVVTVRDGRTTPVASAGPDKVVRCDASTVVLEGSATPTGNVLSYRWEPAAQVSDPSAAQPVTAQPGTYTLTVTDTVSGCSSGDTVVVTQDTTGPVMSAGPDLVITCANGGVSLQGSAAGTGPFEFAWTPAGGLSDPAAPSPFATRAGTYSLTVTDLSNGCRSVDEAVVSEDLAAPVASAGSDATLACGAAGVPLSGSASGGNGTGGYRFAWAPPAAVSDPGSASTTALAAGTFTLTVTDLANGCSSSDDVVITSAGGPLVSAGPDTGLRCSDGIADLSGSVSGGNASGGRTIQWIPPTGVADPSSPVTTTTVAGTYTLLVVDAATGCRSADSVVVAAQAELPDAGAGPDVSFDCDTPDVVTLLGFASGGGGGGFTFAWEPAGLVSDPSVAQPTTTSEGTFTLTVTDLATGCTVVDAVRVGTDVAAPVAEAGPDAVIACNDPAPILQGSATGGNGTGGYAFAWSPVDSVTDPASATPGALRAGTYTLTVTDLVNGCTATDTVRVTEDPGLPRASAGTDRLLDCTTTTVTLNGSVTGGDGSRGFTFRWEPSADVANPAAPTTSTSVAGTYTLTVTDVATGCTSIDTVTVDQVVPPSPVEPSALDLNPAAVPLRITWAARATQTARATWEALPAGLLGRLYQGTLSGLHSTGYDHGRLACGLSAPQHDFRPSAGNLYFLAIGANCRGAESSYGRSSLGAERPDAVAASGRPCP